MRILIEADGGSRGNPGPAGSGTRISNFDSGELLAEICQFIGEATNNVAEYRALVAGLEWVAATYPQAAVLVRMDSKLVIEQMAGRWKIKHPDMRELAIEANRFASVLNVTYQWVPREENDAADELANWAMDNRQDRLTAEIAVSGQSADAPTAAPVAHTVEFNASKPSSVRAPQNVTKPATTIILVRHGRTAHTESKRISGSGGSNPSLSEAGLQDALKAAEELAKFGDSQHWQHLPRPEVVVSSPMARTRETAEAIANRSNLEVEVFEEFEEISFGDWDGLTIEEVQSRWVEQFALWQGSWSYAPPKGESLEVFDERIQRGLNRVLEQFEGRCVVLVSHVMPTRGIVRRAMDADVAAYWRPQISPCSISVVRFWGDEAAELLHLNSTAHLV